MMLKEYALHTCGHLRKRQTLGNFFFFCGGVWCCVSVHPDITPLVEKLRTYIYMGKNLEYWGTAVIFCIHSQ